LVDNGIPIGGDVSDIYSRCEAAHVLFRSYERKLEGRGYRAKDGLSSPSAEDELGPFFWGAQWQFYDLIAALLV